MIIGVCLHRLTISSLTAFFKPLHAISTDKTGNFKKTEIAKLRQKIPTKSAMATYIFEIFNSEFLGQPDDWGMVVIQFLIVPVGTILVGERDYTIPNSPVRDHILVEEGRLYNSQ